ncbi:YitT family protein [uncultured Ruthenibacterium sp.]|uniref:YczE/YyaS/YitT family protein n=1 Tax=uncultured Ruthenibacterium sp. TaxID=1905347 RepID=UPI00349EBF10
MNSFCKRCAMLCVGLIVMAFGVAFSIKAGLGTSPISSLPYVLSRFTPFTVGTATIAMHVTFILLQIVLLRKQYELFQLLQLPVALIFGMLTDFGVWAIQGISASSYAGRWGLCAVGILLVGLGVSLEVNAQVVTLAGEGMVLAVCKVFKTKFPITKIGFDVTLVIVASVLSFLFLGHLEGVREGTAAAALFVGMVAKQFNRPVKHFTERCLC